MGSTTLQDFFAGPKLTELAQSETIKTGLPDFLPPEFSRLSAARPVGMEVEWYQVEGTRELARLVHHTAPSRGVGTLPGVQKRTATALGTKEHVDYGQDTLLKLKSDNPQIAEGARRQIVLDMTNFRSRFDNLQIVLRYSAVLKGKIWWNANGDILPSSSGAAGSIDFGVPNANTLTASDLGDWSSASTDIQAGLQTLRRTALQKSGYMLNHIIYGKNVPGYLCKNTTLKEYFKLNPAFNTAIVTTGKVPMNFLDFQWHDGSSAYYIDPTGTVQSWVGDDEIVVYPDVSPEWYEYFPAGTLIPAGVASAGMTLDQALNACQIVNGVFSYVEMSTNPLAARMIMGDYKLPVVKVGRVLYYGTVKA